MSSEIMRGLVESVFYPQNCPKISQMYRYYGGGSIIDHIGSFSTCPFLIPLFCDTFSLPAAKGYSERRGLSSRENTLLKEHFFTFASAFVTASVFDFHLIFQIYRILFRIETASIFLTWLFLKTQVFLSHGLKIKHLYEICGNVRFVMKW